MRRRLPAIAIFLLAGAVVNVGVAWGCALWIEVFRGGFESVTDRNTDLGVFRAKKFSPPGAMIFETVRWRGRIMQSAPPIDDPNELLPGWTGLTAPTPAYESRKYWIEYRAVDVRGWPLRSLWCEYTGHTTVGVLVVQGGLVTSGLRESPRGKMIRYGRSFPVAFPLRPLLPSFAANTLFYATILWLLILGSFTLRRLIRRRRGLCPACAYDLRHAEHEACPECGLAA